MPGLATRVIVSATDIREKLEVEVRKALGLHSEPEKVQPTSVEALAPQPKAAAGKK